MSFLGKSSIRQILLVIIAILTSLIVLLTMRETYHSWQRLQDIRTLKKAMEISDHLIDAAENLAIERDAIYTMLETTADKTKVIQQRYEKSRADADIALNTAISELQHYNFPNVISTLEQTKMQLAAFNTLREEIAEELKLPPKKRNKELSKRWFNQITDLITVSQELRLAYTQYYTHIDPIITQHMTFKHFLWMVTEYAGRERALIGHLIAANIPITAEDQKQLLLWRGIAEMGWTTSKHMAENSGLYPSLAKYLEEAESQYFIVFDTTREVFYDIGIRPKNRTYPLGIDMWYGLATQAVDSLFALKTKSQELVRIFIENVEVTAWKNILVNIVLLLFSLILCLYIIWVIIFRVIRPIDNMVAALFEVAGLQDASVTPNQIESVSQKDEIGKLSYVLKMYRKTNAIIKENEARLRNIIDNTVDGLITIDSVGIIEDLNPACERIFGYKANKLIGRSIQMLIPSISYPLEDTVVKKPSDNNEENIIGSSREMVGKREDGSTFPLDLSISEIRLSNETVFSGIIRDVTERKHSDMERERFTKKLAESNEELERFAYVASHDLKAPLRAIDNLSQWIEEDLSGNLPGETKEYMDTLRQRVHRMEKLLDDLLEYSRVGRRLDDSYEEIIPGNTLMDDILLLITPPASFHIKISPSFKKVMLHRMPLQQILFNLINNAVKHHDKKAGTIEVKLEEEKDHYIFSVKDDGPGIPEEFQDKIFDMFQTLRPRDEVEGSGIGLAIVKKAIKMHGGELSLDSHPGKGSTFRFTWPKEQKKEF